MQHPSKLWRRILPFALTALAAVGLAFGAMGVERRAQGEDLALAAGAIRRAAVQCYALEGFYPADWSYLKERYGVAVDEERFIVHYAFIASNLIPDITVIARSGEGGGL